MHNFLLQAFGNYRDHSDPTMTYSACSLHDYLHFLDAPVDIAIPIGHPVAVLKDYNQTAGGIVQMMDVPKT